MLGDIRTRMLTVPLLIPETVPWPITTDGPRPVLMWARLAARLEIDSFANPLAASFDFTCTSMPPRSTERSACGISWSRTRTGLGSVLIALKVEIKNMLRSHDGQAGAFGIM